MDGFKEYIEELFLYAPEEEAKTVSIKLQEQFSQLAPDLTLQDVSRNLLVEDEMGLKDYWNQRFGASIDSHPYLLSEAVFRFRSDGTTELDALSIRVYEVVAETMKQFDGVEYFSSFIEGAESK
ncbi:hypothetical protein [uncultured Corynebacterium sp.]|uniref:hypothetical protein n=1 Tax=uncultured Corynebacterium sp. TaxID=159447 RepID=UPI0025E78475|nr:hypothetical protein [uncultured Corynebacterium sp.]